MKEALKTGIFAKTLIQDLLKDLDFKRELKL